MAEQKAVARYLKMDDSIDTFLALFRSEIEERLRAIYDELMNFKMDGLPVDAIAPEGAIYLTIKFELVGKRTATGEVLQTQSDVTAYLLNEARLAIVPFNAFGAANTSPWYRLSVGTCKKESIKEMSVQLRRALEKIRW
jgi:aspartate aminotransferase